MYLPIYTLGPSLLGLERCRDMGVDPERPEGVVQVEDEQLGKWEAVREGIWRVRRFGRRHLRPVKVEESTEQGEKGTEGYRGSEMTMQCDSRLLGRGVEGVKRQCGESQMKILAQQGECFLREKLPDDVASR